MSVQARFLDPKGHPAQDTRRASLDLARRLPGLIVSARQIAASVAHGVHGRRQAGIGESFWQFRPFTSGESAAGIDWRRSARDDRTYIREREWEATQTVWLWVARSASMAYQSSLAATSKIDRALVLGLATADLLVRGGERVGLLGLTKPLASRSVVERLADALVADTEPDRGLAEAPAAQPLAPRSRAVLIGDFLAPVETLTRSVAALASQGALGHILVVADPLEETFPLQGHIELVDSAADARLRLGDARSVRELYLERLQSQRAALRRLAHRHGWTLSLHRTDESATLALMALAGALGGAPYLEAR